MSTSSWKAGTCPARESPKQEHGTVNRTSSSGVPAALRCHLSAPPGLGTSLGHLLSARSFLVPGVLLSHQLWELMCVEEHNLSICSEEMDPPKRPSVSVHARTQEETFVPAGCFAGMFLPGSAVPCSPRKRQGGWSHPAAETGPESSTWSRLHSEVLLGSAFYFLSPALIAGMCLAERCLPGIIPSVFQVLI